MGKKKGGCVVDRFYPITSRYHIVDTTYAPGHGEIMTFKPNDIVSIIDSADSFFVDKGDYTDANGQLVLVYVYNNAVIGVPPRTYTIHNDTLILNPVSNSPYDYQTTYYIRQ